MYFLNWIYYCRDTAEKIISKMTKADANITKDHLRERPSILIAAPTIKPETKSISPTLMTTGPKRVMRSRANKLSPVAIRTIKEISQARKPPKNIMAKKLLSRGCAGVGDNVCG